MSITRADVIRVIAEGGHVQGGRERIAAFIADRRNLEDHLRDEFGDGGASFDFADGSRGFVDWRRGRGVTVREVDSEELGFKWTHLAILALYPVPDQACTPAECSKCELFTGMHVRCRQTQVFHSWGQGCCVKEAPLSLFDLDEFTEHEDGEDE